MMHTHDHEQHEHGNHTHDHDHPHDQHAHGHDHDHGRGVLGRLRSLFHSHSHQHGDFTSEQAFMNNAEGIRTVWIALGLLGATTLLQIVIVLASGSVALLADTLHNLGDALNSVPLLVAFYLARRAATRRYNYGYGKAEDVAGIFIVLSIAISAGVVFWESYQKFLDPEPLRNLGWVAAAAVIGFLGNEGVAILQIRVGRKIGSAALVADGLHARTDGLTSLAVIPAVIGSWLGYPIVDPLVGILIGLAIVFITWDATKSMWYRLMDAIEPETLAQAESVVTQQAAVKEVRRVRMRWMGSRLHAEATLAVDGELSTIESHAIAERVRHALFHAIDNLTEVVVHVEPWAADGRHFHAETEHHEAAPRPLAE